MHLTRWRLPFAALGLIALLLALPLARAESEGTAEDAAPAWTKHAGTPGERYAVDLVWDEAAHRLLVFGGERNVYGEDGKFKNFVMFDDLQAFDPATDTWTTLEPKGKAPSRRAYYAACWDPKRGGMWLHGGFDGKMLGDLFFFDSKKNRWEAIEVEGEAKPSPRDGHDLFYDAKGDRLLLFGGLESFQTMTASGELWSLDLGTKTWTKQVFEGVGEDALPPASFLYCGAFDPASRRLWVTGGFGDKGRGIEPALWAYDAKAGTWTKQAGVPPTNFVAGRMIFRPDVGVCFVFGGRDSHVEVTFDPKTGAWHQAGKEAPPPGRSYHGMAYDAAGRRVFLLGGTTKGFIGPCVPGDLWIRQFEADG